MYRYYITSIYHLIIIIDPHLDMKKKDNLMAHKRILCYGYIIAHQRLIMLFEIILILINYSVRPHQGCSMH